MSSDPSPPKDEKTLTEQEAAEKLIRGEITLGQFLQMPTEVLYKWADIGHKLLQAGSTQKATEIFEGLIAAAPYDSVFHCQLGAAYMTAEKYDDAFTEFDQSIRFNMGNVDALVGRGECLLRRGDVPGGLADFSAAIQKDPELKRGSTQRARSMLLVLQQQAKLATQEGAQPAAPKK